MTDGGEVLDLVEAILAVWDWDRPHAHFWHKGLMVFVDWVDGTDEDPLQLTIIGKGENANYLIQLAHEAVAQWFSEVTNNDACDIEVRLVAAHFEDNEIAKPYMTDRNFGEEIFIRARVLDYLT